MNKYTIEVKEILSRFIEVEAENEQEAKDEVIKQYNNSEIVLNSNDIVDTEFINLN